MSRLLWSAGALGALLFVITASGCGQCKTSPPQAGETSPEQTAGSTSADSAASTDYLAGLSAADRALVEKQKTCPVSGEPLGTMGEPVKITVKDRVVFLCCPGCEAEIRKNPDKYLAKLPK